MKSDYVIINGKSTADLNRQSTSMLRRGWTPLGGNLVARTDHNKNVVMQAFIHPNK
jgi:hypothetical protein